jgi:hypothetical protein
MNIQDTWRWLKGTRQGRFVMLILAFLLILWFVSMRLPAKKVKPDNRVISAQVHEPATKGEGFRLKTNIPGTLAAMGPTPAPTPYQRAELPHTIELRPSPTPKPLPQRMSDQSVRRARTVCYPM